MLGEKMNTETTISILKSTIGNPFARKIIKSLSKYCEKDKKNRIEIAIELFTGKREDACLGCKAAEKILRKFLIKGGEAFGLDEEQIKEKFKDPYWAKALASTLKGIALFGVRRPFTSGAPYQVVWDVTYACNLRCKHCYANAGKPLPDELNTEEAKRAKERSRIKTYKESLNADERSKLRDRANSEIRKIGQYKEEFITDYLIEAKENELISKQLGIKISES